MTGVQTCALPISVAKVAYQYEATPNIAEGFIERTGFGINFGGGSPLSLTPQPAAPADDGEDDDTGPDAGNAPTPPQPPAPTPAADSTEATPTPAALVPAPVPSKTKPARKKTAKVKKDKPVEPLEPSIFGEDFPEPEDPIVHFNEIDDDDRIVEIDRDTGEILDASAALSPAKVDAATGDDSTSEPPISSRGAAGMLSMGKKAE